ncbi:MAG: hypothetical protein NVS1B7_1400 [Candidatus Saccharimonadales bacterium]
MHGHNKWLVLCIGLYSVLFVISAIRAYLTGAANVTAITFSLITNLRLGVVFVVGYALARLVRRRSLDWRRILLYPALIVVVFGLIQAWFLPPRFLEHFGYSLLTLLPFQYVDNKPQFLRIQSTLRGANPLGAYLVIIIAALGVLLIRVKHKSARLWVGGFFAASVLALFYTYSRSAFIGSIVSGACIAFALLSKACRKKMIIFGLVLIVLAPLGLQSFWRSSAVQNTLLHTEVSAKNHVNSNGQRLQYEKQSFKEFINEPLGRGPGTAGPASIRNNHPGRLAENYYLQIGQEVGWVGFGLFLVINILVGRALWVRRSDELALILFASLIGLSFVNLLSHAWADDTLGLLWWGLAGLAVAPAIIDAKRNHHEATEKTH